MYNNRSAGCIAGACLVTLADGTQKRVSAIRKGDRVRAAAGQEAVVQCVVKAHCEHEHVELVQLGGLELTPYHPVLLEGQWNFPVDLAPVQVRRCPAVFNFVLERHHTMLIGDQFVCTLGHGFSGPVVEHSYFGTQRVVQDLQALRHGTSFASGLICFASGCLERDPATGLLVRYKPEKQIA